MIVAEEIIKYIEETLRLSASGETLKLLPHQKEVIYRLEKSKIVALVVPKRSGKTTLAACVALSVALHNNGVQVGILSTSEQHASTICLQTVRRLLFNSFHSDFFKTFVKHLAQTHVVFANGSEIRSYPCTAAAVAGQRFDFLIIDEICYIKDPEPVLVSLAQLDSPQSRALITTTVSKKSHFFFKIYQSWLAGEAKDIDFLYYYNISPLELNPYVDVRAIKSMEAQYPLALRRMLLENIWGEEGEDIVFTNIPTITITDFNAYLEERRPLRVEIAVGLDRALPFSQHGDKTAAVVVAKVYTNDGEEYIVLEEHEFAGRAVYSEFLFYIDEVEKRYGKVDFIRADVYQSYDLLEELSAAGYDAQLYHISPKFKKDYFLPLISATNRGTLKVNTTCTNLLREMRELTFSDGRFSAPAGGHDDFVYALLYAFAPLYDSALPQVWFIDEYGQITQLL